MLKSPIRLAPVILGTREINALFKQEKEEVQSAMSMEKRRKTHHVWSQDWIEERRGEARVTYEMRV